MEKEIRPTIATEGVGQSRYETYKATIDRINKAMDAGFYVEVIALCESIIADRLESLANQISQSSKYSYETMGRLTDYLLGAKQRDLLSQEIVDVVNEIKNWTKKRNSAVHEMAKNIEGDFMEKYAKLKETAEEAIKLFRKLDNEIRKFRKSLK
ncbi:MAG: hypothetical protein J6B65_05340 [Paludibacteraceae bacterium]|nr:hypothetical protein [Paludibacteraceae bacterium]